MIDLEKINFENFSFNKGDYIKYKCKKNTYSIPKDHKISILQCKGEMITYKFENEIIISESATYKSALLKHFRNYISGGYITSINYIHHKRYNRKLKLINNE